VHFTSNKNDHTFGQLLLWPPGWQVDTHFADEPVFEALAGNDDNPAIPEFDPDVGADLYTTNGDTNDHLYQTDRVQSFTPEGTGGTGTGSGFIFQDVEADVQAEFERHVQFALDLARSADDPDNPVSHLGNEARDFQLDTFGVSFGDPQTVQVNARRDIGRITMSYRVGDGRVRTVRTEEWDGGERYGDEGDYWYHRMRGVVRGTDPGDDVEVWFVAENRRPGAGDDIESRSFTYNVHSDSGARVLVLAQEDYTGNSAAPAYPSAEGPFYLDYYTSALEANGVDYDVYDLDAEGRAAPDPLGVLSHYDAVIWYTGNDNVTRAAAQPGVAGEEAHLTTMAVRDFVNEGGTRRLLRSQRRSSVWPGRVPAGRFAARSCDGDVITTDGGVCAPLSNDFLQYYLGSYVRADGGGLDPVGGVFDVVGLAEPLDDLTLSLNDPATSAGNQEGEILTPDGPVYIGTGTHLVTSSILDPETYPQFASAEAADWNSGGEAPFDPRTDSWYMTSQNISEAYKRLTRTVDLRGATGGELSFWTSFNTEQDWDYVFVEAQTINEDGSGAGDWTTLPDANGHTAQATGASCASGWSEELHNRLRNYVTYDPAGAGSCTPTGTTGAWNAASGNSGGWEEWSIDLSGYAGKQVQLSIVYVTDWGTLNVPGMLVDDTTVTVGGQVVAETSFETDLGGWEVPGAHPEGPSQNLNDWIRSEVIFEDAAVTKTDEGLVFGFGLEGVNTPEARADLMERTLEHLLPSG
jgi:Immune inhibitor A peptidase M6